MPLRVLIADNDSPVANIVAYDVRMAWPGSQVQTASSGAEALAHFAQEPADLVILDVALPPPDGFAVLRQLRETSAVPIVMLTVHEATIDKVRAFDLGADDYLTKPFDHLELIARLRALLRRTGTAIPEPGQGFTTGDLAIDFATREVRLGGAMVRLTSTEYRLLEQLARHAGTTVPHHLLIERVWGTEWASDPDCIKVFIRRLRQKLGDSASHPRYILTDWGLGYRLVTSDGRGGRPHPTPKLSLLPSARLMQQAGTVRPGVAHA